MPPGATYRRGNSFGWTPAHALARVLEGAGTMGLLETTGRGAGAGCCGPRAPQGGGPAGPRAVVLGSSMGRIAFQLSALLGRGCEVVGVEILPVLHAVASQAAARYGFEGVRFILGDARKVIPPAAFADVRADLVVCASQAWDAHLHDAVLGMLAPQPGLLFLDYRAPRGGGVPAPGRVLRGHVVDVAQAVLPPAGAVRLGMW